MCHGLGQLIHPWIGNGWMNGWMNEWMNEYPFVPWTWSTNSCMD